MIVGGATEHPSPAGQSNPRLAGAAPMIQFTFFGDFPCMPGSVKTPLALTP